MNARRGSHVVAGLILALLMATSAAAQEVENTSYTALDGSRVLQHRVVVPASLSEVWHAFTTTEGVTSWAVPFAHVDFRLGGVWESSYRLDAGVGDAENIRNRYISFIPLRMIALQAEQAPPDFPHRELLPELFTVFELEALDAGRVRITASGIGYRDGPGYDELYRFFDAGNAWSLQQLHRRFSEGPVDWPAVLRPSPER